MNAKTISLRIGPVCLVTQSVQGAKPEWRRIIGPVLSGLNLPQQKMVVIEVKRLQERTADGWLVAGNMESARCAAGNAG